jgi:hypothetical protein
MRVQKLSSEDLREMISKCLGREFFEVQETCNDDGFMATSFDGGHDFVPLFIPVARFLSAFYDVSEDRVRLFWNAYTWTYRAEVILDA